MLWLPSLLLVQAQVAADPTQQLLTSGNPVLIALGTVITIGMSLSAVDKVGYWMRRRKPAPHADARNFEALVDTQKDLANTVADVAKTLGRLEEYCQRHFEQTGLELRSVREELRAIRERMRSTDGSSRG